MSALVAVTREKNALEEAQGALRDEKLDLELDGPGEAILVSRAGRLPLRCSEATWTARAAPARPGPSAGCPARRRAPSPRPAAARRRA